MSSLPANCFVNNLLATKALTNDQPSVKLFCDNCESENGAKKRCNECGMFLCQFCTEFHKRSRSTKHHKLLTMEELKSNSGPQNIAEKIRCPKHKKEVIKLFCKTCKTTICIDCSIVDHQGHKYGFAEDVAVQEKEHLQNNLNEVKQKRDRLAEGIINLKKINESMEAKKKSKVLEINQHFDEAAKAVKSRRSEMVKKAISVMSSNQKHILEQMKVLEVALASCDSSIEFTERAFKNGNDLQILSMENYILQSLQQLKTVKEEMSPCVPEDMVFIVPSSVQHTLKQYDVAVVSPDNCKTSLIEYEASLKPGKQYSIELICNDNKNRRLAGQVIKPSFSGMEVSDVSVTNNKDGSHVISFCPHHGGVLKFDVSINGIPAPNCSLTKRVQFTIRYVPLKGVFVARGRANRSQGRGREDRSPEQEYRYGVAEGYFESGVHEWKVKLSVRGNYSCCTVEVGIIDYKSINAEDIATTKDKLVYTYSNARFDGGMNISLTVDMNEKTLNIKETSLDYPFSDPRNLGTYRFTARRVAPFFSSWSSRGISIVDIDIVG